MADFSESEGFTILNPTVVEKTKNTTKASGKPATKKKPEDPDLEKRRQELRKAAEERVTLEQRAHQTVLLLIEDYVTLEVLEHAAKYIDGNHYGDVVTERSISNLCGYPICDQQLKKAHASKNQLYRIDVTTNTVYDVTQRKNFCSSRCYAASLLFQKQLSDVPVWLRGSEKIEPVRVPLPDEVRGSDGMLINLLANDPTSLLAAEVKAMKLRDEEEIKSSIKSPGGSSDLSDSSEQPTRDSNP